MHLANGIVDWTDIRALMANRLIALDKCPGVCPISIGECLHRVLGRVLALVTGWEARSACGVDQLACQELKEMFMLCQPCNVIGNTASDKNWHHQDHHSLLNDEPPPQYEKR